MRIKIIVALLVSLTAAAEAQTIPGASFETLPAMLDEAVPAMMRERHVPGAAVVVIRQGKVIYLRGFGQSNIENGTAIDPSTTAFRIGSVSKIFTGIAALTLVDSGKLDLRKNVAEYAPDLRLRYPTTMHQLLTHTAGFDERFAGAYTERPSPPSVTEHLRMAPPHQVFEPGTAYSYSNYNYAVAGAVIERVAGQRFEDYLADHLLAPLGMSATTAYQPPHSGNVARGYLWSDGGQRPLPQRYTFASPSGGVTTSAADIGKLLSALLGTDERLLSNASLRALLAEQYTPHPRIAAASYGAIHWHTRGRDLIFKDGTLGDQLAAVVIDPANAFGVFIASNALPGIEPILDPLLDHVYGKPAPVSAPVAAAGAATSASSYAGTYRDLHHTRNDLSRLRALMPIIQTKVVASADGSIQWQGRQWIEIEPLLLQSADGRDFIVFRRNASGVVETLHAWGATYERIGFFEQAPFHLGVLVLCLTLFVWYPAFRFARRHREPPLSSASRMARRCGVVLAMLNTIFIVGLVAFIADLGATVPLPALVMAWLSLPLIGATLTIAVTGFTVAAWRNRWWTDGERTGYSAFAIASIAFVAFLNYWMLLGYRY